MMMLSTFYTSARIAIGTTTTTTTTATTTNTTTTNTNNLVLISRKNHNNRRVNNSIQTNAMQTQTLQLKEELEKKNERLENEMTALEIMDDALKTYGDDIAIAFSGAEDVALIQYAHLTNRPYRVFSLDTGRLNPETYELFDQVEKYFKIKIEYCVPNEEKLEAFVNEKGLFSFYEDGHKECCGIRKVQPLRKKLSTLKAWITGQRKDQSPGTRMQVPAVQLDPAFQGILNGNELVKYNPLTNATSQEVWDFLRVMATPVNALHSRGYVSIGCAPCTRAVTPGQQEREGRWWWENASDKECGLHSGNLSKEQKEKQDKREEDAKDIFTDTSAIKVETRESMQKRISNKSSSAAVNEENEMIVLYAPWCPFCQAMETSFTESALTFGKSKNVRFSKFRADKDEKEWSKENLSLTSFPTILLFPKGRQGYIKLGSERRDVESLQIFVESIVGKLPS
jgi:adenylyl-sulfate reductase (glutathione)